jgi:hypothetical protein
MCGREYIPESVFILQMCDECFGEFEKRTKAHKAKFGEKYELTEQEVACVVPQLRYKDSGGTMDRRYKTATVNELNGGKAISIKYE